MMEMRAVWARHKRERVWGRARSQRSSRKRKTGGVYFIRFGNDGSIKIGTAHDIARRRVALQISCPEALVILGRLRPDVEARLQRRAPRVLVNRSSMEHTAEHVVHEMFSAARIRGEWFRPTRSLMKFIAENAEVLP